MNAGLRRTTSTSKKEMINNKDNINHVIAQSIHSSNEISRTCSAFIFAAFYHSFDENIFDCNLLRAKERERTM